MKYIFSSLILFASIFASCLVSADTVSAENQVQTYIVRGTIRQLPGTSRGSELLIRHEPIPNYVDDTGKSVTMPAMTMPFQISDSVSLDGLRVGDSVEFKWESQWHPKPLDRIIEIKKVG